MPIREVRGTKPFGKRRAEDGAGRGPGVAGLDPGGAGQPAGALRWALRVSLPVGLLAVAAVSQLAGADRSARAPDRIAVAGHPVPADPETTGAIGAAGAAARTRLDPCLLPGAEQRKP